MKKKSCLAIVKAMGRHIFNNMSFCKQYRDQGTQQYCQYVMEGKILGMRRRMRKQNQKKIACYGSKETYL